MAAPSDLPQSGVGHAGRGGAVAALLRRSVGTDGAWIDVTGASMGRTIPSGARVLLMSARRPHRGEIWAFAGDDGEILVHRFLGRSGDDLWFRGDANRHLDAAVPSSRLIGRVRRIDGPVTVRLGPCSLARARVRLDVDAIARRLRTVGRNAE